MFNETIRLLLEHRSDRVFSPKPVSDEILDSIIECAHLGPTSINAQHVSVVVVRDTQRKARIADIAGGQPWIASAPVFVTVVIDFEKTRVGLEMAGKQQVIQQSVEGFAVGALDSGIALANLMVAARSHGLGIVPIGGIRKDPQAMIDLLLLPPLTFPIVGICMGYVDKPAPQKPRLPTSTFRHDEIYNNDGLVAAISDYDERISGHWVMQGRKDGLPWSANTASFYERVYFPNTAPMTRKQGFDFEQ